MDIQSIEKSFSFYVVKGEEREEVKEYLLSCGKTVGRVGIGGSVHLGHKFLIEKVKSMFDIVIVDYAPWIHYSMISFPESSNYGQGEPVVTRVDKVIESLRKNSVKLDFFFETRPSKKTWDETSFFYNNYGERFRELTEQLGVPNLFCQVAIEEVTGDTEILGKSFLGPKNILIDLISKKVTGSNSKYFPEYYWQAYRDPKFFNIESRTSSNVVLGRVVKEAFQELLDGKSDAEYFSKIGLDFFRERAAFSLIDLDKLERVEHITKNCVLVFMESVFFDYIFIKDGVIQ